MKGRRKKSNLPRVRQVWLINPADRVKASKKIYRRSRRRKALDDDVAAG